jgi:uracil-DNA glycosylase
MQVEVADLASFREVARGLLVRGVAPDAVLFSEERQRQASLLDAEATPKSAPVTGLSVPPAFLEMAERVAYHRAPERWGLLYRVLWRLTHGERKLMEVVSDPDVYRLVTLAKAVQRDAHKMKAFVRFRKVEREGEEYFIAWHRPDHRIVRHVAPFFARRFPSMRWSILTPDESVSWDLHGLSYGPGVPRSEAPEEDALEEMWSTYYASTFNPARLNIRAMRAEMPQKHWSTLPEARLIPELVRGAPERTAKMVRPRLEASDASRYLPVHRDLGSLAEAARGCKACPLYERATGTVFGEGPVGARLMLVGEQPGDNEDREGRPFIGPAGQLLDEVLAQVGLDRKELYLTNAVKHFGWVPGDEKQRLHAKPGRREVLACKAWLDAEVEQVKPRMIVCLGATAAQSFLGPGFRINLSRGQVFETPWAQAWMATFHPSALLRMPDEAARAKARVHFEEDLRKAVDTLRALG